MEMGFAALSVLLFWKALLGIGIMGGVSESLWLAVYVRDLIIAAFFLIIFVYDARFRVILDEYSVPLLLFVIASGLLLGQSIEFIGVGALAFGGFFALLSLVTRGHYAGGGDIRLALAIGAYLGLFGGFVAILAGYVAASLFGLILVFTKREKITDTVPLGSFLVVGTYISLVFGPDIIAWYMALW
jgi:leader peptidase (prepilin peptidase)/N-methyltransferase